MRYLLSLTLVCGAPRDGVETNLLCTISFIYLFQSNNSFFFFVALGKSKEAQLSTRAVSSPERKKKKVRCYCFIVMLSANILIGSKARIVESI